MIKKYIYILSLLVLSLLSLISYANDNDYRLRTVVIDAGHGGKDSGARGSSGKEKEIVLGISLKLGEYIQEYIDDVEVIYTRKTDVFVPLDKRAEIANKSKADLFISIHANSLASKSSSVYGTETYVLGLHRTEDNLAIAKKENSVIYYEEDYETKYQGFDPEQPESYIIFELMQNIYLDQSVLFAGKVEDQFANRAQRVSRGVKQAGFLVLRETTMPSVLVEVGFLSNQKEERYLLTDEGQSYIASAIFRAFREYKNTIEKESKFIASQKQTENDNLININRSLIFKIQILSSRKELPEDSPVFKDLKEDVDVFKEGRYFKYTVHESHSLEEIQKYKEEVNRIFKDAFIIAFHNGKKISLKAASNLLNKK